VLRGRLRRRGKKLGGYCGVKLSRAAQMAGCAVRSKKAAERATDLAPTITEIQQTGVTSFRGIAAALNERSIPTARGRGNWSAVQVQRVMER